MIRRIAAVTPRSAPVAFRAAVPAIGVAVRPEVAARERTVAQTMAGAAGTTVTVGTTSARRGGRRECNERANGQRRERLSTKVDLNILISSMSAGLDDLAKAEDDPTGRDIGR